MPKSQRGVAISEGLRRSAEARRCPTCGRGAALVERIEPQRRGEVCRWSEQGKCNYPGAWINTALGGEQS